MLLADRPIGLEAWCDQNGAIRRLNRVASHATRHRFLFNRRGGDDSRPRPFLPSRKIRLMKNLSFVFLAMTCFALLTISGCGRGGENTVVEAPPAVEEEVAMPGMTDEEYDKAMEADMQ